MPTTPQDYQPKGAAQIDHACKGYFRGCLIGDPMGLGRTLQAICSMKLIADEPGIILVVCPASLCIQWVQSIENAFGEVSEIYNQSHFQC
jgi:SNF2 family DNA or RNA helicase